MNDYPLVSIIIPLYNKQDSIRETLNSVIFQKYINLEIVIVDDGSTDDSVAIVQTFTDSRIKLYRKTNGGVSSARNYGIKVANGDYISFLDADDLLFKNNICILMSALLVNNADCVIGNIKINDNLWPLYVTNYSGFLRKPFKHLLLDDFFLRTGNFLIKRKCLNNNKFSEKYSRFEDLEFAIKIFKTCKCYVIADVVMKYRTNYSSASSISTNIVYDYLFNLNFRNATYMEKIYYGRLLYTSGGLQYGIDTVEMKYKSDVKWMFIFKNIHYLLNLRIKYYKVKNMIFYFLGKKSFYNV